MAERLYQQPTRIATGPGGPLKSFFRRLNTRLHADDIAYLVRQAGVEMDQKINSTFFSAIDAGQKFLQKRAGRFKLAVDHKIGTDLVTISERPILDAILHKKVEGIIHCHISYDVDLDFELDNRIGEDIACQPIAIGILLVIHEMICRGHFERMRDHPRSAVGCWPQADKLGTERNWSIISVVGQMMNCRRDCHFEISPVQDEQSSTFCCNAQCKSQVICRTQKLRWHC